MKLLYFCRNVLNQFHQAQFLTHVVSNTLVKYGENRVRV